MEFGHKEISARQIRHQTVAYDKGYFCNGSIISQIINQSITRSIRMEILTCDQKLQQDAS